MKLISRTHKVGCAARNCHRIATYHFFMPARTLPDGRTRGAFEVYACATHAAHYAHFTTNYTQCQAGYTIQSASVNEVCHS